MSATCKNESHYPQITFHFVKTKVVESPTQTSVGMFRHCCCREIDEVKNFNCWLMWEAITQEWLSVPVKNNS